MAGGGWWLVVGGWWLAAREDGGNSDALMGSADSYECPGLGEDPDIELDATQTIVSLRIRVEHDAQNPYEFIGCLNMMLRILTKL